MKLVLVLAALLLLGWLLFGRSRRRGDDPAAPGRKPPTPMPKMVACAHCGVHLPGPEALPDSQGRHFCSPAHRDAGPR